MPRKSKRKASAPAVKSSERAVKLSDVDSVRPGTPILRNTPHFLIGSRENGGNEKKRIEI